MQIWICLKLKCKDGFVRLLRTLCIATTLVCTLHAHNTNNNQNNHNNTKCKMGWYTLFITVHRSTHSSLGCYETSCIHISMHQYNKVWDIILQDGNSMYYNTGHNSVPRCLCLMIYHRLAVSIQYGPVGLAHRLNISISKLCSIYPCTS